MSDTGRGHPVGPMTPQELQDAQARLDATMGIEHMDPAVDELLSKLFPEGS